MEGDEVAHDDAEGDEVLAAMTMVVRSLTECNESIAQALARARAVVAARQAGETYAEIFDMSEGQSVLELMSAVLATLSDHGSTLRRAEARALYDEGLPMEKIARLFGVSRQRVSSLLHQPALDHGQAAPGPRPRGRLAFTDPELRMIAEALPHIVCVAAADGSVEYLNRRGADYFGVHREATHEWDWIDFVHPDDVERARQAWEDATRSGSPLELAYRIRRADGAWHVHVFRALPFRGPDGQVAKWLGTATDIDDYVQRPREGGERE